MRYICSGLVLVLLGGCGKTPDAPEVRLISADGSGAAAGDATATSPGDIDALAAATREKLLALAVASECLRKGNTPPEQSANTMLALYKAHEVDLVTYTREMSRLAGDPAFQAEIDAKTRDCAVAAVTPDVVVASDTQPVDTSAATDSGPEIMAAAAPDAVAPETLGDTFVAPETLVDTFVAPEIIADTRIVDTTPEAVAPETRVMPEVSIEPEEVAFTGTWTGKLYGGGSPGNLRLTINGRTITSAVATFGKSTIRLKGSISEKGALSIGGTADQDFIRISGMVQSGGRGINGTWDGVVEKRRGNGRFLLKR